MEKLHSCTETDKIVIPAEAGILPY